MMLDDLDIEITPPNLYEKCNNLFLTLLPNFDKYKVTLEKT